MSITVVCVTVFTAICFFVTGLAIIRIWKMTDYPNKPLWIAGYLFGFVGFGVDPSSGDDPPRQSRAINASATADIASRLG